MKIGFWFDYGATLSPHEGIGIFAANLIRGLLRLPEPPHVVLLVRPGDGHVVEPLRLLNPRRVEVVPQPHLPQLSAGQLAVNRAVDRIDRLHARRQAVVGAFTRNGVQFKNALAHFSFLACRDNPVALLACISAALPALVALWAAYAAWNLARAVARVAWFPLRLVEQALRSLYTPAPPPPPPAAAVMEGAGCDVWVFPYMAANVRLSVPSVVFVHDLVFHHHPEGFDPDLIDAIYLLTRRRVREATLVACMSDFIRRNDLLGALRLDPRRVRMVPTAAPADLPEADADAPPPAGLERPYLFYPAAFRPYKNHGLILRAVALLRDAGDDPGFDVVFTGPNGACPPDLERLASELGLRDRVRVLGKIDRAELAAIYHHAFAAVVPTLYEQASFPVYEALSLGCPVACSDVPPLREQCAAMGDAMLYFDPADAASLAAALRELVAGREAVRLRQAEAGRALFRRGWGDVAADCLKVFREAAALGAPLSRAG